MLGRIACRTANTATPDIASLPSVLIGRSLHRAAFSFCPLPGYFPRGVPTEHHDCKCNSRRRSVHEKIVFVQGARQGSSPSFSIRRLAGCGGSEQLSASEEIQKVDSTSTH